MPTYGFEASSSLSYTKSNSSYGSNAKTFSLSRARQISLTILFKAAIPDTMSASFSFLSSSTSDSNASHKISHISHTHSFKIFSGVSFHFHLSSSPFHEPSSARTTATSVRSVNSHTFAMLSLGKMIFEFVYNSSNIGSNTNAHSLEPAAKLAQTLIPRLLFCIFSG